MTDLHVLRVFTGSHGSGGNLLGVVLDGPAVPAADRQAIAAKLNFSETAFVDDAATGSLRIFTPAAELPFAGHPLVGTAWLLRQGGRHAPDVMRPPAGEVRTWHDDGLTWIRGRAEWAPEMELREYGSPAEVDALAGAPDGVPFLYAWAWEDEVLGTVRSRSFPRAYGIAEDDATGAAAIRLTAQLGRPLRIHQGRGSLLVTEPGPGGTVELAGRVALDEVRPLP
jgi:predicted PhzF superfamily epimerase YddE/YHI9